MRISLAASDVSQDFETAVELGYEWGIRDFELRHVFLKRVPDISDEEELRVIQTIKEYNVNITAISPGLFKIPLIPQKLKNHLEVRLPASFRLAEKLKTNMIIVMGVLKRKGERREEVIPKLVDILQKASKRAQKAGIILAVENEDDCWIATGKETAEIIKMVDSPALKVNWDPGNAFGVAEDPYPEGYNYVKDYIANVHIKDAVIDNKTNLKKYVVLGKGKIDWYSQVKALKNDGYEGYIALEPHISPRVKGAYRCYKWLKETVEKMKED